MASADDESPKANEEGHAEKQGPSSNPSVAENSGKSDSQESAENKKPIKRVKANTIITKTVLDVDACENNASELFADGRVSDEPPVKGFSSINKILQTAKPAEAKTSSEVKVEAKKTEVPPPSPAPSPPPVKENAAAVEATLSPIKRVKANEAIARTKIDLDACRDVAFNSVEEQVEKFRELSELQEAAPVKEFKPIDKYREASPCSSSWEKMTGATGCMKFCEECQLLVYDFSKLELAQAEQIILQREDKDKNFILYRRKDGKFLARDCPVGAKRKQTFMMLMLLLFFSLSALVYYFVSQAKPAKTVIAKKLTPKPQVLQAPPLAMIETPETAEPEVKVSRPAKLKKTKVSFDRAAYLKRIKDFQKQGKNTKAFEDAMRKIEQDINEGKHPYVIEPQIQELGENIGLLKRVLPASASASAPPPASSIVLKITRNPSAEVFSSMGFAAGFSSQPPAVIADIDPYITAKFSDSSPLAVTEVLSGSVAEQAGLRPGQRILAINGEDVEGMRLAQIRSRLQGESIGRLSVAIQTARGTMKNIALVKR
ncbi:MAG: PDZ domain-containing protein [Candidatus Obscuribacterales bacterium]|nr:PDZ domain-containing protein [Candidatus Obscuribacterales bacterium]